MFAFMKERKKTLGNHLLYILDGLEERLINFWWESAEESYYQLIMLYYLAGDFDCLINEENEKKNVK